VLLKPPRLVSWQWDTNNSCILLKPLRGSKETRPLLDNDTFSMLVQLSMPSKLTRSGAMLNENAVTPGLIPFKLLSLVA
jgi:hypothetical protein